MDTAVDEVGSVLTLSLDPWVHIITFLNELDENSHLPYLLQMMWHLVRSSWLLHVSCNKRRVAPIAALLSSVLHDSVFSDMDMHEFDDASGPLKWVCNNFCSSLHLN